MILPPLLFGLITLVIGAWLIIVRKPDVWTAALFALMVFTTASMAVTLTGQPRPSWLLLRGLPKDTMIIAQYPIEGKDIFLFVILPNHDQPTYIRFPWDETVASNVQDSLDAAKRQGFPGIILPQDVNADHEKPMRYPPAVPKLPDKGGQDGSTP